MSKQSFPKKAQMEMLGLALIVILISIAMLFVIRFVVLEKPSEHKKEFTQAEIASNFISTLLKTTNPKCRGLTFTELFQDVAEGQPSDQYIYCDPGNSREYLISNVSAILQKTLDSWNMHYELSAVVDGARNITPSWGSPCTGEKTQKQFAIPVDSSGARTLYVRLDIC